MAQMVEGHVVAKLAVPYIGIESCQGVRRELKKRGSGIREMAHLYNESDPRGETAAGFPIDYALVIHVLPPDFLSRDENEIPIGRLHYAGLVHPGATREAGAECATIDGFRYSLSSKPPAAFVHLLRNGGLEFGIVAGTDVGVDFVVVRWVFTESLAMLTRWVTTASRNPPNALIVLALHDATPHGFSNLDPTWFAEAPNAFE